MQSKKCSRCQEIKPRDKFSAHLRMADGLQSRCKACYAALAVERRVGKPCMSCGTPKEIGIPRVLEVSVMAFEVQVTQTVRMACDRCGKTQAKWFKCTRDAINAARSVGDFHDASYDMIQAWLCGGCFAARKREQRGKVAT